MQLDTRRDTFRRTQPSLWGTAAVVLAVAALAAACSDDVNPPVAAIIAPQTAQLGEVVEVDGSASSDPGGKSLSFSWRFISLPTDSQARFNDPNLINPSFVVDRPGEYVIELVVSNGFQESEPATATIVVGECGNNRPVIVSISSEPGSPDVGDSVRFSAEVTDEDNSTDCGLEQDLEYQWDLSGLPTGSQATLNDPAIPSPVLVADVSGSYTVTLRVTDSSGLQSDLEEFTVQVATCGEAAPVVAGVSADPAAPNRGDVVSLSAEVTDTDNDEGCVAEQTFTYAWDLAAAPAASNATIPQPARAEPSFVPDVVGEYVIELVVTDSTQRSSEPFEFTLDVGVDEVPQPVVTATPEEGLTPLTVGFTCDTDTGTAPLSYAWTFGNGAISTQQNPSFTYNVAGRYTATCVVTDANDDVGLASVDVTVVQDSTPQVVLSASPAEGIEDATAIVFSSTVTGGNRPLAEYRWDFGDGSAISNDLGTTTHVFESPGTFLVTLEVEDNDGSVGTATTTVSIEPNLDFTEIVVSANPRQGVTDLDVQFNVVTSGGNPPLSYLWDFGASGIPDSVLQNPAVTFATPGTFDVTVTVTDADGDSVDNTANPVSITAVDPDLTVTAAIDDQPAPPVTPHTVDFTCTSDGAAPVVYAWTFGDGGTSTAQNPSYTYGEAGSYTATCTATDVNGARGSDRVDVTVEADSSPVPTILGGPLSGVAPLTIDFNSSVTGGNGAIAYAWDFGDAAIAGSTDANPAAVVYNTPGTYSVVLDVVDSDPVGPDTGSATVTVVVGSDANPEVSASATPLSGPAPLTVQFTAVGAGGNGTLSYLWDFDDLAGSTSVQQNPSFTFTEVDQTFNVTVTVTDEDDDTDSATVVISTVDLTPVVDARPDAIDNTLNLAPFAVTFECEVTSPGNIAPGSAHTFFWDFGDGTTSTDQNPRHVFNTPGTFTPSCTATDDDGSFGSESTGQIVVQADTVPEVAISADPSTGIAPLDVDFTSSVTGGNGTLVYAWDFESDGTTDSSATNPSFTYTSAGTFLATLRVTDQNGAGQTGTATATITVSPDLTPVVTASAVPSSGIEPLDVQLNAAVVSGNGPFDFQWMFELGSGLACNDANFAASSGEPNYTQQSPGRTYLAAASGSRACVRVEDADGDVVFAEGPVFEIEADVDVTITQAEGDPVTGIEPLNVAFTCSASGNAPITYQWDFGDGLIANQRNVVHTYDSADTYEATCTATDADGDSATSAAVTVIVDPDLVPIVDLTVGAASGVAPYQASLTCNVASGNLPLDSVVLDFGDGTPPVALDSADLGVPQLNTYDDPGTYTATCTATDFNGDSDTDTVVIAVEVGTPALDARAVPSTGASPLSVSLFADLDGGDPPFTFSWDFGDGTFSDEQNPVHVYSTTTSPNETFTASVTVTDADNDVVSDTVDVTVEPNFAPSVTAFTVSESTGQAPLTSTLSCTFDAGNAPNTLTWTFGDGTGTTTVNNVGTSGQTGITRTIEHTYASAGTFESRCTVTDSQGDESELTASVVVTEDLVPSIELTAASPTTGIAPLTVDFVTSVTSGNPPLTYTWDFGDDTVLDPGADEETHEFTDVGTYIVRVTVFDDDGDSDSATLTVVALGFPEANAGDDQAVNENTEASLDGSGSTDPQRQPLTYDWTQVGGTNVDLLGTSTPTPSFTAPDGPLTLTFALEVCNTSDLCDSDTVVVTVISSPTAVAGGDAFVSEGGGGALADAGSTSPNAAPYDTLTYQWTQIGGADAALSDAGDGTATITAPPGPTSLTFELEVCIAVTPPTPALCDTDAFEMTVLGSPTAAAEGDAVVNEGDGGSLADAGSTSPNAAPYDTLTYEWTQTAGADAALNDAGDGTATFTAPPGPTSLTFELEVCIAVTPPTPALCATDLFEVTVIGSPTADAGPDDVVNEGDAVTLDGTGSDDPQGQPLTYSWTELSESGVEVTGGDTAEPSFTAPTGPDELTFQLEVCNEATVTPALCDTDTVVIDVIGAPIAVAPDDFSVDEGTAGVELDGSASTDPNPDPYDANTTFSWTQIDNGSPTVTLANANTATATFDAPGDLDGSIQLEFQLEVCNETVGIATDPCDTDTVLVDIIDLTCSDGIQNQQETDVDCGGPNCGPCDFRQGCVENTDCQEANGYLCDASALDVCNCDPVVGADQCLVTSLLGVSPDFDVQAAIDAVNPSGTVFVPDPATPGDAYVGDLQIFKTLSLVSDSGPATTLIQGEQKQLFTEFPLAGPNIDIQADGVLIDGFTIASPAVACDEYSSGIVLSGVDIEIANNDFVVATGDGSQAIQTWAVAPTTGTSDTAGLWIHDNTFTHLTPLPDTTDCDAVVDPPIPLAPNQYEAIYINPQTNEVDVENPIVIEGNTFVGELIRGVTTLRPYVQVSSNILQPNDNTDPFGGSAFPIGVQIQGSGGASLPGVEVIGNDIFAFNTGVRATINLSNADDVQVNFNNIQGNTSGLTYATDDLGSPAAFDFPPLDAQLNYWNSPNGPLTPGCTSGCSTGDSVDNSVIFTPWLCEAFGSGDQTSCEALNCTWVVTAERDYCSSPSP